jgi:hypothetical protein
MRKIRQIYLVDKLKGEKVAWIVCFFFSGFVLYDKRLDIPFWLQQNDIMTLRTFEDDIRKWVRESHV